MEIAIDDLNSVVMNENRIKRQDNLLNLIPIIRQKCLENTHLKLVLTEYEQFFQILINEKREQQIAFQNIYYYLAKLIEEQTLIVQEKQNATDYQNDLLNQIDSLDTEIDIINKILTQ